MLVARPLLTIRPHVLTALTSRSLRGTLDCSLQADCTLCHTSDGVTAFVTAVRQSVDLVVLAEELPALTGLTVARLLRERMPTVPIVLLAAHSEQATVPDTLTRVDAWLPKPWDASLIVRSIQMLLKRPPAPGRAAPAAPLNLPDPLIEALIVELSTIQRMLLEEQHVQKTRRLRQAIGQLEHTKRRLAALGQGEE